MVYNLYLAETLLPSVHTARIGFKVRWGYREFRTPRPQQLTLPRSAPVPPASTGARWPPCTPCPQPAAAKRQSPHGILEAAEKVAPKRPAAAAEARPAAPEPRPPPPLPGERAPPTPQPLPLRRRAQEATTPASLAKP